MPPGAFTGVGMKIVAFFLALVLYELFALIKSIFHFSVIKIKANRKLAGIAKTGIAEHS